MVIYFDSLGKLTHLGKVIKISKVEALKGFGLSVNEF